MRCLFILLCCLLCVSSYAADTSAPDGLTPYGLSPYGLAMHGAPKYSAASPHLDYANPTAPKGGHITYSAIGSFDTVNPYTIKGKAAFGLNLVTDRLMARTWDEPFTLYPLIAQSYAIAPDRSWISFTLNPKARFHDGSAITLDDIEFSFTTLRDHGRPNMQAVYKLVSKVTRTDKDTIRFDFAPGYDQETAMILALMPILSQSYWQDKNFDETTLTAPLGNGPYQIKTINPGRSITYSRAKNYWAADHLTRAGHNNFDEITYEYFRDENIAREAFKAGNITLRSEPSLSHWMNSYNVPAAQSDQLIKDVIPHQRPEKAEGLIFNTRRAPFDDIRVRQALGLLLDADWINQNLYFGQFKRINSYYPNAPLAWDASDQNAVNQNTQNLRQKRREAEKLFQDAGWTLERGTRVKDGQPMRFEILLSSPKDEKIAIAYKNALRKAGIEINIRSLDTAAFRDRLNNYDFDMVFYFWLSSLSPGTEQMLYYSCEAGKQIARWNFPGICDAEIDALAASIPQATTRAQLVNAVKKLDHKLIQGHYMIPLFYSGADRYAYWQPVKRPEKTPLYGAVLETWWMDQNQE